MIHLRTRIERLVEQIQQFAKKNFADAEQMTGKEFKKYHRTRAETYELVAKWLRDILDTTTDHD